MIKEANGFGATLDEAKENAISNLGASELDDIQFEIISMPKKKVLGIFGGCEAQVRAFVEVPDKKKPSKKVAKQPIKKEVSAEKNVIKKEVKKETKIEPVAKTAAQSDEYSEAIPEKEVSEDSATGRAIAYIKPVLTALDCKDITISVKNRDNASLILLDGEDISILIGRRGETLEALQYLCSLAANNGGNHYRISLNIGNYREKREVALQGLAERVAAQVLKTGKNRVLEPMNPYERRIIHTAIQGIDGVVSNSFGEGSGRRVIISLEGAKVYPPKNNDRRRNNRKYNSKNGGSKSVEAPQREPKKDSDIPLYGKIN